MQNLKTIRQLTLNERAETRARITTLHITERAKRLSLYGVDYDKVISGFLVDKDHKDGMERHLITENGYIMIFNHDTKRFITVLSGRPSQIKRYYRQLSLQWCSRITKAVRIAHERNEKDNANYFI